jgi:hypothetical protein
MYFTEKLFKVAFYLIKKKALDSVDLSEIFNVSFIN